MAIARIGAHSDVYVIGADWLGFACVCCRLQEKQQSLFGGELHDDFDCRTAKEMLDHLNEHFYNNPPHKVPKTAFDRMIEMWDADLAEKEAI